MKDKKVWVTALTVTMLLLCAVSASASTTPCGTLAAPTSCAAVLGGLSLSFDSFTFASSLAGVGSGTPLQADDVKITLVTNANVFGLQFTPAGVTSDGGNWAYTGSQLEQWSFGYRVSLTGTGGVTGVQFTFSDVFGGTGVVGQNGSGSGTKDVCTGAACGTGGSTTVSTVNVNDQTGTPGVPGTYSGSTAPPFSVSSPALFFVRDTISEQANNQSVQVSQVANNFATTVPEPSSLLLGGLGLLGVGFLRRRLRQGGRSGS